MANFLWISTQASSVVGIVGVQAVGRPPELGQASASAGPAGPHARAARSVGALAGEQQPLGIVALKCGSASDPPDRARAPWIDEVEPEPVAFERQASAPRDDDAVRRHHFVSELQEDTLEGAAVRGARSKKNVIPGRGSRKVRGVTRLTIEVAATRAMDVCSAWLAGGRTTL